MITIALFKELESQEDRVSSFPADGHQPTLSKKYKKSKTNRKRMNSTALERSVLNY